MHIGIKYEKNTTTLQLIDFAPVTGKLCFVYSDIIKMFRKGKLCSIYSNIIKIFRKNVIISTLSVLSGLRFTRTATT